jgi:hypothetical protein
MTICGGQIKPERSRVWKTHKRRGDFDECPDCGQPLRWLYVNGEWLPCSHEPVMFILHPDGKNAVIYKRELYETALLYKKGDPRFNGIHMLQGYIQHYYSCPILRQERQEWARRQNN